MTAAATVAAASLAFASAANGKDAADRADAAGTESGTAISLSLPVDCRLGETCFVQNYMDVDAGPAARDFSCGPATYDGHKGTDFRVLSSQDQTVRVIAVADGTVLRGRDTIPDRLLRDYPSADAAKSFLAGRDCGNGLVVDHGGGWTTQYCHLRQGSIAVRPGQKVARGQPLGDIGYSGRADFAHVHLTVRHGKRIVDPFTGMSPAAAPACLAGASAPGGATLWADGVVPRLGYASGVLIGAGLAGATPTNDALERDHRVAAATAESPVLVLYARVMNLPHGGQVRLSLNGPDGFAVDQTTKPTDRHKATYLAFAGKRRRSSRWPVGRYTGEVMVLPGANANASAPLDRRTVSFDLR